MNPFEQQLESLKALYPTASASQVATGAHVVELDDMRLPAGWSHDVCRLIFVAPTGYPAAQPDCFWVEAKDGRPFRLANDGIPLNTNESNPVPGLDVARGTWFSWHLQKWDPNRDTLDRFVKVIMQRLEDVR